MALVNMGTTTSGCSACLVAAIERQDEAILRRLLTDPLVVYNDTMWLPIGTAQFKVMQFNGMHPKEIRTQYRLKDYSIMSSIPANLNAAAEALCPHPETNESLEAGLRTRAPSPLFWWRCCSRRPTSTRCRFSLRAGGSTCASRSCFTFDAIRPVGAALIQCARNRSAARSAQNTNGPDNFLLVRTLLDASVASFDDELIAIELWLWRLVFGSLTRPNRFYIVLQALYPFVFIFTWAWVVLKVSRSHRFAREALQRRTGAAFSSAPAFARWRSGRFGRVYERDERHVLDSLSLDFADFYTNSNAERTICIKWFLRMGLIFPEIAIITGIVRNPSLWSSRRSRTPAAQ